MVSIVTVSRITPIRRGPLLRSNLSGCIVIVLGPFPMGQVVRRNLTRSVLPGGARCFVGVDGMIGPAHCPSFVDRSRAKIRLLSFRSARQAADGKGQNRSFNVTAGFVRFHGYSVAKLRPRKFRVTLSRRGAYLSKNDSYHLI